MACKVGNNLAMDGSRDNLIKIEGLDTHPFKDDKAAWGVTKECPNPTPEEAEKAKALAFCAARNAWSLLGDSQDPDGEISEGEVDFSEGEVVEDSESEGERGKGREGRGGEEEEGGGGVEKDLYPEFSLHVDDDDEEDEMQEHEVDYS